jgi:hypothetical protein
MLIVGKKHSLTAELKDDARQTSVEATYSNGQSTVLSLASIFESLWIQTDLYQKLRESEKIKDDFVNIAAHELLYSQYWDLPIFFAPKKLTVEKGQNIWTSVSLVW